MKKIYIASCFSLFQLNVAAQAGLPDSSFGNNGIVIDNTVTGASYASALQPDGKIILTGSDDGTAQLWQTVSFDEYLKSDKIAPMTPEQKKNMEYK